MKDISRKLLHAELQISTDTFWKALITDLVHS